MKLVGRNPESDPPMSQVSVGDNQTSPTQPASSSFVVRGLVRDGEGRSQGGVTVRAFDLDLRSEKELGRQITAEDGAYVITYDRKQFARPEKSAADLQIRVQATTGKTAAQSAIRYQASQLETIDIVVGADRVRESSEWEKLRDELAPSLQSGKTSIGSLTNKDEEFLAGATKRNSAQIHHYVLGYRFSDNSTKLKAVPPVRIEPDMFYGLFRQQMPTGWLPLLKQDQTVLRSALLGAMRANIIRPRTAKEVDRILADFKTCRIQEALRPSDPESPTVIADLLDTLKLTEAQKQAFVAATAQFQSSPQEFWKSIRESKELAAQADDLEFTFTAASLTQSYLPLVLEIRRLKRTKKIKSLRDLAGNDKKDWEKRITAIYSKSKITLPKTVEGKSNKDKMANLARTVARAFEDAFPTAAIARRIAKSKHPLKADLCTFFAATANANFEFGKTSIADHVAKNAGALKGVKNPEALVRELKAINRVFGITPYHDEIIFLRDKKIGAARHMVTRGKPEAIEMMRVGLGPDRAATIWNIAETRTVMAAILYGKLSPGFDRPHTDALPGPPTRVDGVAEYKELFGAFDLCDCEDCLSVFSPAAYLVDILQFLKQRKLIDFDFDEHGKVRGSHFRSSSTEGVPNNAQDALFLRRADLGEIELNCENTKIPVPYIDLVNEILEAGVPPAYRVFRPGVWPGVTQDELDRQNISASSMAAFPRGLAGFSPGSNSISKVEVVVKGRLWRIHDESWIYGLKLESASTASVPPEVKVLTRGRQTSGTAEERAALPEYQKSGAYQTLARQPYPFTLPFDLFVEETRIYLRHLGFERHDLMRAFQDTRDARRKTPSDLETTTEHLCLSTYERDILTGQAEIASSPFKLWGLEQSLNDVNIPTVTDPKARRSLDWDQVLGHVHLLLERTDLTFAELSELLKLPCVQAIVPVRIASRDPDAPFTCDVKWLVLHALDVNEEQRRILEHVPIEALAPLSERRERWATMFTRICRLLRLRRKLGWSSRELSVAIRTLGWPDNETPGSGSARRDPRLIQQREQCLEAFSVAVRLKAKLGLQIEPILAFWSPMETGEPDSLYNRIFLNPALGPIDAALLIPTPGSGASVAGRIGDHATAIMAALGLSATDFAAFSATGATSGTISLEKLSRLYRETVLARALRMSVTDFHTCRKLIQTNPFNPSAPTEALDFIKAVEQIRNSSFSIPQLSYLLRHESDARVGVAPTNEQIAFALDELRTELRKIHDEALLVPDETGKKTASLLVTLGWDEALVERTIAVLSGNGVFEVPLETLAERIQARIPDDLKHRLSFDAVHRQLRFVGTMRETDRVALDRAIPPDLRAASGAYIDALQLLYDAPKNQLVEFADEHRIEPLAPGGFIPAIAIDEIAATFDEPERRTTPSARFEIVLSWLVGVLGKTAVKRGLTTTFQLEDSVVAALLDWPLTIGTRPNAPGVMELLLAEDFWRESSELDEPTVKSDAREFASGFVREYPAQVSAFVLMSKVAQLVRQFKLTRNQLRWLIDENLRGNRLNLRALPVTTGTWIPFSAWVDVYELFSLRNAATFGAKLLDRLADLLARPGPPAPDTPPIDVAIRTAFTEETGVAGDDFNRIAEVQLAGWRDLSIPGRSVESSLAAIKSSLLQAAALLRIAECLNLIKRLGATSQNCLDLAKAELTSAEARTAGELVRAKYSKEQWLKLAKDLRDPLREKQRDALVSYHIAHPPTVTLSDGRSRSGWNDINELYAYFLIDPEMSSCQLTTRLKQAAASVQLFVQRCLMNLEPEVRAISENPVPGSDSNFDPGWLQWKWMKNYRVWEANRKIFCYPENWIEPELRDDKSPFYQELESQLLQNDVTSDAAETVSRKYVEKLAEVARLEVLAVYRELKDDGLGSSDDKSNEVLHVFGRTYSAPRRYFYRRRNAGLSWTPWEPMELDIPGDHLVPVVWNGRLHLFWPVFKKKSVQSATETAPSPGSPVSGPGQYFEIQLAWSEYRNGKWSSKKLSSTSLDSRGQYLLNPIWINGPIDEGNYLFELTRAGKDVLIRCYACNVQTEIVTGGSTDIRQTAGYRRFAEFSIVLDGSLKTQLTYFPELFSEAGFGPPDPADSPDLAHPSGTHWESERLAENISTVTAMDNALIADLGGGPVPLLMRTPGQFNLVLPRPILPTNPARLMFFQDSQRTYSSEFESQTHTIYRSPWHTPLIIEDRSYVFRMLYHPYAHEALRELNRADVSALLNREFQIQREPSEPTPSFGRLYEPQSVVPPSRWPVEDIDFSPSGSYSCYNWELFFHAPLLVAERLSTNQRFEEAQQWFHFIFNPTDTSSNPSPQKYWVTKPFFTTETYRQEEIGNLLRRLAAGDTDEELIRQVHEWRAHPFKPHVIARSRTTAYQKATVMKHLDNLIAWGDQLFRQDTMESINEAAQLFILASKILGKKPEIVPSRVRLLPMTYDSISPLLDGSSTDESFSDPLVPIEELIGTSPAIGLASGTGDEDSGLPSLLYFCVPANEKLMKYWDIVADRLFKIRQCMNIEGVVRQLPLYEPPIDPALLVRAAASGVDIGSVLRETNAPLPYYRFNVMSQRASDLCSEVKALGGSLLSALEKSDAEALSLLRSQHEIQLLAATRSVRQYQLKEAEETLTGLNKSRESAALRYEYYKTIAFINPEEKTHLALTLVGGELQLVAQMLEQGASAASAIPDLHAGAAGMSSPVALATTGGSKSAAGLSAVARALNNYVAQLNLLANLSATMGGHRRRWDDWKLQEKLAAKELEQIDRQIAAAEIRKEIARLELANHDLQIEHSKALDEMMRSKFTNKELYDWMIGQVSSLYFQSYQLAYDAAKRAERAFRFELGLKDSNFIQFGYWDSLKKGLLAGERLHHDLKRMETAYLEKNKREFEITKHVSLRQLSPIQLLGLRTTGACSITLPRWLFDLDCPGHFMRRIKHVALSIPAVTGPYSSVPCKLTLETSSVRLTPEPESTQDLRPIESIVTSSGSNDSGLFEANLRDERYLPFEGAGVEESRWRLELPQDFRPFDYDTIADVILHFRFTARDGGIGVGPSALKDLLNRQPPVLLLSLRHDFPVQWQQLMSGPGTDRILQLPVDKDRFPYFAASSNITVNAADIRIRCSGESGITTVTVGGTARDVTGPENNVLSAEVPLVGYRVGPEPLSLKLVGGPAVRFENVREIILFCGYSLE